jgi:lipoprotein-releasing system permease protein
MEAALIGIAGAMLGWILGYVLCLVLGSIEVKSPFLDSNHLPISYSPIHYIGAAAIALLSSMIAGLLPARKAARVHPVEIIRGAT